MSQPGICSFCFNNIVCATAGWGYHHPSYSSLTKSARQRCAFCTLLHADVAKQQGSIRKFALVSPVVNHTIRNWLDDSNTTDAVPATPESSTSSLYRWSVRSLARTSETNLTVAITFRVVPQSLPGTKENATAADARLQTFGLAERVFYCFPENDLGALLSQAKLGTSTNPDINAGHQIKSWIRTCGIEHKHCPKRLGAGMKFVPSRLLYVGRGRRGDPVRVVDTKASKVKGPYVTLSHCWGEDEGVRRDTLTSKNYVEFHEQGVPWSYLSRTFKEAIEVARFLEVDYLWIDSLCIIQGNDKVSREDWEREGSLMHKVYKNSYSNIAAADAPNSKRGLFRNRKAHDVFSARFESDGTSPMFGERVWRAVREDLWNDGLLQRPLYKRGWVFQERMLAPRIIHFSQHQIFWDCAAMSACETLPEGLPLPLDRESAIDRHWRGRLQEAGTNQAILMTAANDDAIESFWRMAVENYTSLNLTFQTDKRRALWGIAKLVRDGLNQNYAVGMWGKDLEEQLAWRVADYTVAERPRELTINPSWAWPSVKGTILVGEIPIQERIYKVTNHEGQPLAFKTVNQAVRPSLGREPSETFEEEVAAMSRDLQLVEERRRQSSASSRHNSQLDSFSSRQNSQADLWSPRSQSTNKPLEPRTQGNIISGMTTMSPQQTIVDPDEESESVQGSEYTTRQNSVASSLKTQDMEPELAEHRIPILGYRRQGTLRLDSTHGRWTIDMISEKQPNHDEFLVEAYPDVRPEANSKAIDFVVLVLSEQAEDNRLLYYGQTPVLPQKPWFEGHGIMLQPAEVENCYTRLGSFKIRRLSPQIWNNIKNNEGFHDSSRIEDVEATPDEFYLV